MSWSQVQPPSWTRAYLIAGGPSLKGFDLEWLRGRTVLVVNNAVRHVPWATAVFSADRTWALNRQKALEEFGGERYLAVGYEVPDVQGIHHLQRGRKTGLSDDPREVHVCSSGYGALNVAYLKGAKEIILLGYDYKQPNQHWFPENGHGMTTTQAFAFWADRYSTTLPQLDAAGVKVWNASLNSLIAAFPKISLEEVRVL